MSRVYLDANVYIYFFDANSQFHPAAERIFRRLEDSQNDLFSSLFILSELLVLPLRVQDEFRVASLQRLFRTRSITMVPFEQEVALLYASLRAHHRIKPLDALHLACAASAGVDRFITNDLSLTALTLPGIGAITGLTVEF